MFWNKDAGASFPENTIKIFYKLCFGTKTQGASCPGNTKIHIINYVFGTKSQGASCPEKRINIFYKLYYRSTT